MKRNVTAVLWFLAIWVASGTLVVFAGWPSLLGPVAGLIVGAFVWLDPAGWLWTASADAAIRRRRLADLPRVTEASASSLAQRDPESAEG